MTGNPPWKNPPLQETILEIRFPAVKDYAVFLGTLMTKNSDLFEKPISLGAADLPASIVISGQVRHRFKGKDNNIVFQVGSDTLSINAINYPGFNNFKNRISSIIDTASESIKIANLQQISLRYINKFSKTNSLLDVLNIQYPISNKGISKTKGLQIRSTEQENENTYISTNIVHSVGNDTILDINGFYTDTMSKTQWDLDSIMNWTDTTHDIIYKHFESLVNEKEKENRK